MTYSAYGPTKVNGAVVMPSQRPSTISFFTLTIPGNVLSENGVVNGVFDLVFKNTLDSFATVAMIGTPSYSSPNTTVNFALEDTGADAVSASGLGLGNSESGTYAATTSSLQALVQGLGNSVGVNSVDLTSALVRSFTL